MYNKVHLIITPNKYFNGLYNKSSRLTITLILQSFIETNNELTEFSNV